LANQISFEVLKYVSYPVQGEDTSVGHTDLAGKQKCRGFARQITYRHCERIAQLGISDDDFCTGSADVYAENDFPWSTIGTPYLTKPNLFSGSGDRWRLRSARFERKRSRFNHR
jgi:hypothetical protein